MKTMHKSLYPAAPKLRLLKKTRLPAPSASPQDKQARTLVAALLMTELSIITLRLAALPMAGLPEITLKMAAWAFRPKGTLGI
jgi:hypothetical protein